MQKPQRPLMWLSVNASEFLIGLPELILLLANTETSAYEVTQWTRNLWQYRANQIRQYIRSTAVRPRGAEQSPTTVYHTKNSLSWNRIAAQQAGAEVEEAKVLTNLLVSEVEEEGHSVLKEAAEAVADGDRMSLVQGSSVALPNCPGLFGVPRLQSADA